MTSFLDSLGKWFEHPSLRIGAVASLLRGGRYVYDETSGSTSAVAPQPLSTP